MVVVVVVVVVEALTADHHFVKELKQENLKKLKITKMTAFYT